MVDVTTLVLLLGGLALLGVFLALKQLWKPLAPPPPFSLRNKHVLITGGSSGIGKALAEMMVNLGKEGPSVITIVARDPVKLSETKSLLTSLSPPSLPQPLIQTFSCDVSNWGAVEETMKEAEHREEGEEWKPVDVVVCSAGATAPLYFHQLEVKDFKRLMDINYLGVVHCLKALIPSMQKDSKAQDVSDPKLSRGGRVVVVSSQVGLLGMFGYSAYSPTKFALRGLVESLIPELKPHNIHFSISYPPDTATAMYDEEMRTKPIECKKMSESGSVFPASKIASDILDALTKQWKFSISHGFDGKTLEILSGGLSVPSSIGQQVVEVVTFGFLRLVWIWAVLAPWFKIAFFHSPARLASINSH